MVQLIGPEGYVVGLGDAKGDGVKLAFGFADGDGVGDGVGEASVLSKHACTCEVMVNAQFP